MMMMGGGTNDGKKERTKYTEARGQRRNWSQCDQVGRFIALWATFQNLWQQLFCPNHPHFRQFL